MSQLALAAIIAAVEQNRGISFGPPDSHGGRSQLNGPGYLAADGEFYPAGVPAWFHHHWWAGH